MAAYWNSASYGQYQPSPGYEQYPPQQQSYGAEYGYAAPQQMHMPPQHMGYQQSPSFSSGGRPQPQQPIQPVPYQGYSQPTRQHVPPQPSPQYPQTPRQEACALCGIVGHWAQDCPTSNQNKQQHPQHPQPPVPAQAPVAQPSAQQQPVNACTASDPYGTGQQPVYNEPCYNCGGHGHWAQYCPEGRRPHPFGQKGTPSQPPTPMTAIPPAAKYAMPSLPPMPREISTPAAPVPYSPQHPSLQGQQYGADQKKNVATSGLSGPSASAQYTPEDEGEIPQEVVVEQNHVDVGHDGNAQGFSAQVQLQSHDSAVAGPKANGVKSDTNGLDSTAKLSQNAGIAKPTSPVAKTKLENGVSHHSNRPQQNGTPVKPPPPPPPPATSTREVILEKITRDQEDPASRTPVPESAPTQNGDDPFGPAYENKASPATINGRPGVKRRRTDSVSDSELLGEGSAPEPERPKKRIVDKAYSRR